MHRSPADLVREVHRLEKLVENLATKLNAVMDAKDEAVKQVSDLTVANDSLTKQVATLQTQLAANPSLSSDDQLALARLDTEYAALTVDQGGTPAPSPASTTLNPSGGTATPPATPGPVLTAGAGTAAAGAASAIAAGAGTGSAAAGSATSPLATTAFALGVTGGLVTDGKGTTLYTYSGTAPVDPAVWTLAGQYGSQNVYYYKGDTQPGQVTGDGLGGVWAKIPAPPAA